MNDRVKDDSSKKFNFNISLSVLNHLGRNLYRNFITVLGEAISNSRDADAENVWVYVDNEHKSFVIKDDWIGMSWEDFQNKFLKIGYSKRKDGECVSSKNRPFIGKKWIWKLALLSCAKTISIVSKKEGDTYIWWKIDNSWLDQAIHDDLNPDQYPLETIEESVFQPYVEKHQHGTIIYFEWLNDGVKNSLEYIRKLIALYFRFSLADATFKIYLNDEIITNNDLEPIAKKTQFLRRINEISDPYIDMLSALKQDESISVSKKEISGFVASVEKPTDLKVLGAQEKLSLDLFVNGRLREKDILKHIPTARIVESYIYGQIHYNELDGDGVDRFTSSRESVIADDPKYKELLNVIKDEIMPHVIDKRDKWRLENREEGDSENARLWKKERKSRDLYNIVSAEYIVPVGSPWRSEVDWWINALAADAEYNFSSYADCFISENLLRKYISHKGIDIWSKRYSGRRTVSDRITELRGMETDHKSAGNINIDIRQNDDDLSYLDMECLTKFDPPGGTTNTLSNDAKEYKPIRDALAHTSLLTQEAKTKLNSVYNNIKWRIRNLLSAIGL